MDSRAENDPSFYLYVLECADGTWYTGYTVDVAERVRAHNAGAVSYTHLAWGVRVEIGSAPICGSDHRQVTPRMGSAG